MGVKSKFSVPLRQHSMQNVLVLKWWLHLVMRTFYCSLVRLLVRCVRQQCVLTKLRLIQKSVSLTGLAVAAVVFSTISIVYGVVLTKSYRLMCISLVVHQHLLPLFMVLQSRLVYLIKNSKVNKKKPILTQKLNYVSQLFRWICVLVLNVKHVVLPVIVKAATSLTNLWQ